MSESTRIALVLGATGGIGGETALALARHGWKIRAFARGTSSSSGAQGGTGLKGMPWTGHPSWKRQMASTPLCTR